MSSSLLQFKTNENFKIKNLKKQDKLTVSERS